MAIRVEYLFFDMNSYFASVAQNEEPDLIGRPVGILTTDTPNAGCIAASIEAKLKGVGMGTRPDEARALCPGIVFRPARHDVCVDYHHRIRAAVDTVLPIAQAHSVDEFSCALTGRQQDLDTALHIAQTLQQRILRDVGPAMTCSVGVAPSVLLAKLAAEMKKPLGINWLHPDVLPGKIAHLSMMDIPGISNGVLARLEKSGVSDVSGLYALQPKHARAIWGSVVGEKVLRALHGEAVDWTRASGKSIGHGQRLIGPNKTPEGARLVARRLLVKAAARLRREGRFTRALTVSASPVDGPGQRGVMQMASTQDTFVLLEGCRTLWTGFELRAPIASVSVMLSDLSELKLGDLFAPGPVDGPTSKERLCYAVDGLNRRFGKDTVHFGRLPLHQVPFTGAKIAFSRVPEIADFHE